MLMEKDNLYFSKAVVQCLRKDKNFWIYIQTFCMNICFSGGFFVCFFVVAKIGFSFN